MDAEVVYLAPDTKMNKVQEDYPHIKFKYMWERMPFSNRILNKLAEEYYGWKFARSLKCGDVVFLTNFGNIFFNVIKRKNVKVVHEKTEHPDIYSFKGFNVERYKREIPKLDGMFVISTALKDYFSSLGLPKEKIEIVNMTVDSNCFLIPLKRLLSTVILTISIFSLKGSRNNCQKSISPIVVLHPTIKMGWMN